MTSSDPSNCGSWASASRLSKRWVFRRPRPGEGGEKPIAFGRSARLPSSFFPSIRLNRGTSAAFQLKRRPGDNKYRFRRVRNAGSVAALTQLGAATDPAFQRKRSTSRAEPGVRRNPGRTWGARSGSQLGVSGVRGGPDATSRFGRSAGPTKTAAGQRCARRAHELICLHSQHVR
jgi:hypothetical protein